VGSSSFHPATASPRDGAATGPIRAGSLRAWQAAVRPRTLLVAISPVLVGASIGFERAGALNLLVGSLALCAAVLMQSTTNMQNDVGYTVRGGDGTGTRAGLPRATARGWLSVGQLRAAIVLIALLSLGLGLLLIVYRGWPLLLIGTASLLAAVAPLRSSPVTTARVVSMGCCCSVRSRRCCR